MSPEEKYNRYFEANKEGWNKRTNIHKNSTFYDVSSFKAGKSSLKPIELEEVGAVKGKSLLHLQCHFGMDTLSWAREGAQVTGIDISNNAIDYANEFNNMVQGEDGNWLVKGLEEKIPMMYSIKAEKQP